MKNKSYYIDAVLKKEKRRNEEMLNRYEKRISDLPRGNLFIREVNGRKYCYLRYRDGKNVVLKYAGTGENEEKLRKQIEERKHLTDLKVMLEEEKKRILKMEAIK